MSKKYLHDFESYRENKNATNEGMSIYELEEETEETTGDEIADLDSETPEATEPAAEAEVAPEVEEAPIEEAPAAEEEALDFGDGGAIPQETATAELEFILGIVAQYQKLVKKEMKLDDSMKMKIRKAYEILK